MYESPITLMVQDIAGQMVQQTEQTVLEVVRKCGVNVDKDELIKAINYDRDQYSKGYKDGAKDVLDKIRSEIMEFAKNPNFGDLSIGVSCGAMKALEIIDKYREESEK